MKKAGLLKLQQAGETTNEQSVKSIILEEINEHLKQIGINTMGVLASSSDDEEFLKLYAKLVRLKAQNKGDQEAVDSVYNRSGLFNLQALKINMIKRQNSSLDIE